MRLFELVSGLVSQLVFHLVFHWQSGNKETKVQITCAISATVWVSGGGVGLLNLGTYGMIMRLQVFVTSMRLLKVELKCLTRYFSCFLTFNET